MALRFALQHPGIVRRLVIASAGFALTHYEMFPSFRLTATVLPFLNGISGVKGWSEQIHGRKQSKSKPKPKPKE